LHRESRRSGKSGSRSFRSRLQSDPHRRRAVARCRCGDEQNRVPRSRFRGTITRFVAAGFRYHLYARRLQLDQRTASQSIVAFIRRRLKPAGLLYVSYDAMPGWAGIAPLRRVLVQHAAASGALSEIASDHALAFADKLKELGAQFYRM